MGKQIVVQNVHGEIAFFARTLLFVHIHRRECDVGGDVFERVAAREGRVEGDWNIRDDRGSLVA